MQSTMRIRAELPTFVDDIKERWSTEDDPMFIENFDSRYRMDKLVMLTTEHGSVVVRLDDLENACKAMRHRSGV